MEPNGKQQDKNCVVCGARVTGWHGFHTCSSICFRASKYGRSRPTQIKAEMRAEDRAAAIEDEFRESITAFHRAAFEDVEYNRPYMAIAV